ncbi:ATP-dependent nuclease [Lentilitoribacter sp. EG35]|uniref:ATP-dependent nuclease n=1 Tax=Lentilitoribacter sp. EG35 TaxID=3234192 RepID=UPI003460D78B
MYISKLRIRNFRLLKDVEMDLEEKVSLLVGKNNTGKTSLLMIFEKFFDEKPFTYNDFNTSLRSDIDGINKDSNFESLKISLQVTVKYTEDDNLKTLSEFIQDLDPDQTEISILFECSINHEKLLADLSDVDEGLRNKYIQKKLSAYMLKSYYSYDQGNRVEKKLVDIKKLINLQIIHAKRNVASSDSNRKPISTIAGQYFHHIDKANKLVFQDIEKAIAQIDDSLTKEYRPVFEPFLEDAKSVLELNDLSVKSDIETKMLLESNSQVVYGEDDNNLPENMNGLGILNILYLLLQIDLREQDFKSESKDINLLFIEEPEAHTHPQMQYVFADKTLKALSEKENLQTLVTTHSSHVVSRCNFDNIRYLQNHTEHKYVVVKNFLADLSGKYTDLNDFKFLKQYITLNAAELFFASKVIFIEGTTERMLLPYFIDAYDEENGTNLKAQNISVLEVGANAKVFVHFLYFIGVKSLIITDIDTTEPIAGEAGERYKSCKVDIGSNTSNTSLKHFFEAPADIKSDDFTKWFASFKAGKVPTCDALIYCAYQQIENKYHARSFEDAFIHINKDKIKQKKDDLLGLKNIAKLDEEDIDSYVLTEEVLDKKSDFAASILYQALVLNESWETPKYIKDGLGWLCQD